MNERSLNRIRSMSHITTTIKQCTVNPQNRQICYVYVKELKACLDKIGERI